MGIEAYKRLAQRLDAIPNGFPATESGVELRLLARMFTVEEAGLASEMRVTLESVEQIAGRTKREAEATGVLLNEMLARGLIRSRIVEGNRRFGLMPFVVGVYESQLERLDEETARLFEEYYGHFAKGVLNMTPSLHVVVPAEKSIRFDVEVFPYEQASMILDNAKSFGVRKCICRVQKKLVGTPCKFPEETCLIFAPVEGAFDDASDIKPLTKNKALTLLKETEKIGLIHSSANVREGHGYICNCCTCCCGIIRGVSEFGIENSVAKSNFVANVNPELCIKCGACQKRCQFHAITITDGGSKIDKRLCAGCGLCQVTCPSKAIWLERKPENQRLLPPVNNAEWMARRAKNRGINLGNVL